MGRALGGRRWLLAAALIALLAAGLIAWRTRERDLLASAARIVDVRGWPDSAERRYDWLSDTRVMSPRGGWRLEDPFVYDLTTRQTTPLRALDKLVNQGHDGTGEWVVSADGNWVVWILEFEDGVRAAHPDGSGYHVWPLASPAEVDWLDESRQWVAINYDRTLDKPTAAILGDVTQPGRARPLTVAEAQRLLRPEIHDETDTTIQVDLNGDELADRSVESRARSRTVTLHAPSGTTIVDVQWDPDGRRLAWLLADTQTPPLAAWLHRWFSAVPVHSRRRAVVWLSRPDGTQMHELGYIGLAPGDDDSVEDLQWLPSGKRLSFVYRDALWTVPVP